MTNKSEIVDVVVVGGGAAGLAAAVASATRGMKTVLLEKEQILGGTTRLSVGSFSAAGTRLQRRAGIVDNPDHFREDMVAFAPALESRDNSALRAMLAVEASVTLSWLEDLGVVFVGPFPEPPHRVNRMHNVIPNSQAYIDTLAKAARDFDVTVQLNARVRSLIHENGSVGGVVYTRGGGEQVSLVARRGVVLATGDFSGNPVLRKNYLRPEAAAAIPVNPQSNGDGHQMAKELGAAQRNMDMIFGPQLRFPEAPKPGFTERLPKWRWVNRLGGIYMSKAPSWMLKPLVTSLLITHMSPSESLFEQGAILVDLDGRKVVGETPAAGLAMSREATGHIVFDDLVAKKFAEFPFFISTAPGIAYAYFSDYERGRPDLMHHGASLEELARLIGVPAIRLSESAKEFRSGPFHAMGPVRAMLTVTEGALSVDTECRVLDEGGSPIDGLYAAGGIGQGGMMLKGHGLHIGWALTSGRIAGETVARREA